jgi:hypothetical protein
MKLADNDLATLLSDKACPDKTNKLVILILKSFNAWQSKYFTPNNNRSGQYRLYFNFIRLDQPLDMFQKMKRYSMEAKLPWRADAGDVGPAEKAAKGRKVHVWFC